MNDPWKFIAFPISAVIGYLLALGVSQQFSTFTGLSPFLSEITVVAISGFVAGFMVDEVIPTYIKNVRGSEAPGDLGGGGGGLDDEDLDFE